MSDPERPALPDPQQDRHVAFPELTPPTTSDAHPSPAPGLPPDAWARHEPTTSPAPTLPPPTILGTPPTRRAHRAGRRRPAWLPYAAIVGVFLVMSNVSTSHDDAGFSSDSGYSEQQWGVSQDPWADPPDPSQVGWISSSADPSTVDPPIPADTPVSPVPASVSVLRVEVTAPSTEEVLTQISNGGGLYDETTESTPVLREVHTGPESRTLDVTVSSPTESTASLQCRVYVGETLVALDTATTGKVACTVSW